MKKYFRFTKTYTTPVIYRNAIAVLETIKSKKKEIPILRVQGKKTVIKLVGGNSVLIENLLSNKIIVEVEKPSQDFLESYIYEPKQFSELNRKWGQIEKKFPQYSQLFSAISLWTNSTKGSPAVNLKTESKFLENPSQVLKQTKKFGNGIKAKPGAPHANRAPRTAPICNESEWENDPTSLLATGIKKNESMTFQSQIKLFNKLIQTIIDIFDTPADLRQELCESFNKSKGQDYRTPFYLEKLSIQKFKENLHHNKVKGCELMHIDPWLEYASVTENLEIGTSEENRHQGGYPIEFTHKKCVIWDIYRKGYHNDPDILNEWTLDQLQEFYYKKRYQ